MKSSLYLFAIITTITFGCSKSSNTDPINEVPVINNISPTTGPANTIVTITGTGFNSTAALNSVFFNGAAATVTNATSTTITAKVPVGAGTGNITLRVNNNTISGSVFNYELSVIATVIAGSGLAGTANGTGTSASFSIPTGLTLDNNGNIYVADLGAYTIRKITPQAVVSTLAGKSFVQGNLDGIGTNALFHYVNDVAVDIAGNVYAADFVNSNVRKITPGGVVTTFLTQVVEPIGIAIDAQNYIYIATPSVTAVRKISPAGVVTEFGASAIFRDLYDVALDNLGNMYVCDRGTHLISKITPSGVVTAIAGIRSVSGNNNGPGATATFNKPSSIAVDNNGNIYVADVKNNSIRKINSSGIVSTYLANVSTYTTDANFFGPYGVAVDKNGVLYVSNTSENKILRVREE